MSDETQAFVANFRTQRWAVAPLGTLTFGSGKVFGASLYALLNRDLWRQHYLLCVGVGLSADAARAFRSAREAGRVKEIVEAMREIEGYASKAQLFSRLLAVFDVVESPTTFHLVTPRRAASFEDFDGRHCRMTKGEARVADASAAYLTIWDGRRFFSDELVYKRIIGSSQGIIPFAGHVLFGETTVLHGDGEVLSVENPLTSRGMLRTYDPEPPGRPDPRLTDVQVAAQENPVMTVPGDVLFEHDGARIRPEAEPVLRGVAETLNDRFKLPVRIEGHADSTGSAAHNMDLSFRRAKAVKDWFTAHGVLEAEGMALNWHGEARPVASNETAEGRARNRRVEIRMAGRLPRP